jgi:hypothetical protein
MEAHMKRPTDFTPDLLALMGQVCDDAWLALNGSVALLSEENVQALRTEIAARVITAVGEGERDPVRLKEIALGRRALLLAELQRT